MSTEKLITSWNNAPFRFIMPFIGLIFFCTIVYGIGMKIGSHALGAVGFVGVLLGCMYAFNRCYQKGYTDGEKEGT